LVPDEPTRTRLVIHPEGLEFLRNLTGPVSLVSFIGKSRAGKSFSLNHLLGIDHADGFKVGHTYKPETIGVSLWSEKIGCTDDGGSTVSMIFADTEGLDSGLATYETALLLISARLSSRIVYHVSEYVYTDDIVRLHGLACLVEHFEKIGVLDDITLPTISWVVHKTDLLKVSMHQTDTGVLFDTWLAEKPNPTESTSIAHFNSTARVVKTAFSDHKVYLVPTAIPPAKTNVDIVDMSPSELAPGYVAKMQALKNDILMRPSNAIFSSGSELADTLESILPAANDGVDIVGDTVADSLIKKHAQKCRELHLASVNAIRYPVEESELNDVHLRLESGTINTLWNGFGKDENKKKRNANAALSQSLIAQERELRERFTEERLRSRMNNEKASDHVCADALKKSIDEVERLHKNEPKTTIDVDRFDVFVVQGRRLYESLAIGPMRLRYGDIFDMKTKAMRDVMSAEMTPMRRISWAFGAMLVFLVLLALNCIVDWLPRTCATALVSGVLRLGQLTSVALAVIAIWSYVGNPGIDIETIIGASDSALCWMSANSVAVTLSLAIMISGMLVCGCERRRK
jgi:hypothetical protein